MSRALIVTVVALILTGCAPVDMDQVMGRTDGTATSTPQKLDCDLIFPAPAQDTLTP